ncbi:MAG: hypothetical protein LAO78_06100 [Acidobacteriia bacterium]|nr:hypothetical protein [Terriglobia bacterium]
MAACVAVMALSALAQPQAAEQQAPQPQVEKPQAADQPKAAEKKGKNKAEKPYALIFGTAYGPDDRPLYGVKITIRSQTKKHPSWELMSDHRGEFAQRVPPGPSDYLVHGEAQFAPAGPDGKPQISKAKRLKGETKIHVENEERLDISVHLTE